MQANVLFVADQLNAYGSGYMLKSAAIMLQNILSWTRKG